MEKKTPIEEIAMLFANGSDEIKSIACDEILSISGTETMIDDLLMNHEVIYPELVRLLASNSDLAFNAGSVLINLSSHSAGCRKLAFSKQPSLVLHCVENICDSSSKLADICCMILSNISRESSCVDFLSGELDESILGRLMAVLFEPNFNKAGCNLQHLANFFANLAQSSVLCSFIIVKLNKFKKSFLDSMHSVELLDNSNKLRKRGFLALYRNLALNKDSHSLLLDGALVGLFTSALFAFINSIKSDSKNHNKANKSMDSELCLLLLDILLIFCATKRGRNILRECDVYVALRALHSTASDKAIEIAAEKVVDILIRTEEEIGVDDYLDLKIPDHLAEKFKKLDNLDAKEIEQQKMNET